MASFSLVGGLILFCVGCVAGLNTSINTGRMSITNTHTPNAPTQGGCANQDMHQQGLMSAYTIRARAPTERRTVRDMI